MANLFEKNSYIKEFRTEIIRINKIEKKIKLKDTAFYAKGGGQPGDSGNIIIDNKEIKVLDTIKSENSVINIIEDMENVEEKKEVIKEETQEAEEEGAELSISEIDLVLQQLSRCFIAPAGAEIQKSMFVKISAKIQTFA